MPARCAHPVFARIYQRASRTMDERGGAEHRRRLLEAANGVIIEVGAGNGLNFSHYPAAVSKVLAVEPEPRLRAAALVEAGKSPVSIVVVDGTAEALPAEDSSFDAGVASLVLCSVRDQQAALAELFRVIRPGGRLLFYEHIGAAPDQRALRTVQRLADATVWPLLLAGCHAGRDTVGAIERAGFVVENIDRFPFPPGMPHPASPHVLGSARRP